MLQEKEEEEEEKKKTKEEEEELHNQWTLTRPAPAKYQRKKRGKIKRGKTRLRAMMARRQTGVQIQALQRSSFAAALLMLLLLLRQCWNAAFAAKVEAQQTI
jgi:hypothetical protein